MRKVNKKSMTRKLDKVFAQLIKYGNRCYRCGKTDNLQCCHIYSRRYRSVRWDIDNATCLCAGCHFWAHQNPTEFAMWLIDMFGMEWMARLTSKAHVITKRSVRDMQDLYEEIQDKLDKLGAV